MNTVISLLILFANNTLNEDSYYSVAKYILENLSQMENISANTLAKNCHTSITTVNNFCHKLGFESYKKLKTMLINTKNGRLEQIKYRYLQFDKDKILKQVERLYQKEFDIEKKKKNIDKIVSLIHDTDKIYCFGAVFPLALLVNFVEDMLIFNKVINLQQISYKNEYSDFDQDSLLIFITITGRFLTMNKQMFLTLNNNMAKKVIISQKTFFDHFDVLLKLNGNEDDEVENLIILEIFNLIKYKYFMKYINK